jgi:hypothetical protein
MGGPPPVLLVLALELTVKSPPMDADVDVLAPP